MRRRFHAPGYAPRVAPYRGERESAPPTPDASAPVKDAIDLMVRQFADELAFYRELVQNAIDAGATRVDVHLRWDAIDDTHGTMRISVTDDGSGMTQDVVERALLVLFRSTKERDPTKIGKFGVGFFSVFALGPEVVTVETGTGVGEALALTLQPDFKWELAAAPPRKGTTVTLKVPYERDNVAGLAGRSIGALSRWCPHVAIPLWITIVELDGTRRATRIDAPFDPKDGVTLVVEQSDGARYSLRAAEEPCTRFFNRGILLHESASPVAPGVLACIDHPRLGHTISRDDVRRDATFESALARARQLAGRPLRERVVSAVTRAAEEVASGPRVGASALASRALLADVARAATAYGVPAAELTWPLVDPLDTPTGRRSGTTRLGRSARKNVSFAPSPSPLTATMAAAGVPVVDVGDGRDQPSTRLLELLRECFPGAAHAAALQYGVAHPHPGTEHEDALLGAIGPLLESVGIPGVAFAELEGLGSDQMFIALDALPTGPTLLTAQDVSRSPFALLGGRPILISHRTRPAIAALELASRDPRTAAFLLARLLLLSTDALKAKQDASLLRAALEHE